MGGCPLTPRTLIGVRWQRICRVGLDWQRGRDARRLRVGVSPGAISDRAMAILRHSSERGRAGDCATPARR